MPAGTSGNCSFAHVAALPKGEAAAGTLVRICKQLRNAGADGAAERFEAVDSKIAGGNKRFEDLERHIDPDRAVDELNSARGRPIFRKVFRGDWRGGFRRTLGLPKSVRAAHISRNVAALLPLIFTWIMLGLAAQRYSNYINHDPRTADEPFLLLWQQGFGTGFPSFEFVTLIDFALLALVVVLTYWVHWAEARADRSADLVYEAIDALKTSLADVRALPIASTPLSPEDWAEQTSKTLSESVQLIQGLTTASQQAITEASERLLGVQDSGKEFIEELKAGVLDTLTSVSDQNQRFIETTRETNQQVLQALVVQQMQPLLTKVQDMLDQFRAQQAAYTSAVTNLTASVSAIEESATGLAGSAQAFEQSTHSIADSLSAMASSQERFAANVESSAKSMNTAAAAMEKVKDSLHADLHEGLKEMTSNITSASTSLDKTQAGLADTTNAMGTAATQFSVTAGDWSSTLREPMDLLKLALSQSGPKKGIFPRPFRRS